MQEAYEKAYDNDCSRCGMNGHWACIFHTFKYFVDLYQASIKGKDKRFESHSTKNAYDATNTKVNNALMEDIMITPTPIEAKSLDVLDFFEDPKDKVRSPDLWKNTQT